MRTTVDIPDDLMNRIRSRYKGKTKRSIIILGLKKLEKSGAYDGLRKLAGKFPDLRVDIDMLRNRNNYKKFL